ncbi:TRAP transporter small permease subunit [Zhengella mangrovi]|nr:TRAP transporter small permease [Zhengella mangrovi]
MFRAIDLMSKAMVRLSTIGIILMLLLVVADVLSRAVANVAIPGIDTIVASYLMVAIIFLPLALLQLLEENIAVDVLRDNVPNLVKDLFDITANLLAIGFYALLGWIYFKVAVEAFEIKEFVTGTWDVPVWPARVFMPLGLFLGSVAAAAKLVEAFRVMLSGTTPSPHDSTGAV